MIPAESPYVDCILLPERHSLWAQAFNFIKIKARTRSEWDIIDTFAFNIMGLL